MDDVQVSEEQQQSSSDSREDAAYAQQYENPHRGLLHVQMRTLKRILWDLQKDALQGQYGDINAGDQVQEIINIKTDENNDLLFYVKWKTRKNGFQPQNEWVPRLQLRNQAPQQLLTYYEGLVLNKNDLYPLLNPIQDLHIQKRENRILLEKKQPIMSKKDALVIMFKKTVDRIYRMSGIKLDAYTMLDSNFFNDEDAIPEFEGNVSSNSDGMSSNAGKKDIDELIRLAQKHLPDKEESKEITASFDLNSAGYEEDEDDVEDDEDGGDDGGDNGGDESNTLTIPTFDPSGGFEESGSQWYQGSNVDSQGEIQDVTWSHYQSESRQGSVQQQANIQEGNQENMAENNNQRSIFLNINELAEIRQIGREVNSIWSEIGKAEEKMSQKESTISIEPSSLLSRVYFGETYQQTVDIYHETTAYYDGIQQTKKEEVEQLWQLQVNEFGQVIESEEI